ncbi:hypothetical protein TG4357_01687 [Thalassovita gelatinovora]|uniref:Uncharacterized protein n=1 Tax=Thalassovita gelatinovora TaxID=53501 RepID=A0A0P1FAK3_THAGE|nr:hypothetical protein [Thalassovita gelatinovora]QIZ80613.1 hypothetical protein HFZ77_09040 [Thalassovita gelatinovora]CUH65153.1 hypothetical protein TG4357_01687 [Thalassovita gelatinovora]SER19812.1 hypothetical protein SAMN04488043_1216 [Thalassovita gelatinovora]
MYITQIEVSQMQGNSESGQASGFVSFDSDMGHVQMHCAVTDVTPTSCHRALISEALRQLGRMPEYRNGRRTLSFAPGILAAEPAAA